MTASDQPRFRYVNETVGLIVLVTLVVFFAGLLGSGRIRDWLNPGSILKVILPEEGLFGLTEGSDVEILGTRAGKVLKIVIDPNQQMYAEVQIQEGMEVFIRRDSSAVIRKRFGLAGSTYLEITRGTGGPLDWEYAVITAKGDRAPTDTLATLIDDFRTRLLPVMEDLRVITGSIARGEGTLGRLIREKELADLIETMLKQLEQTSRRLGPILVSLEGSAKNAESLTVNLNAGAKEVPDLLQSVRNTLLALNGILEDLKGTTPDLPRITRDVREATTSLPELLLQTQQTMTELEKVLRQMQSSWLLGGSSVETERPAGRIVPLEVRP